MQLRADGERAVLVGHDGVAEREVDPRRMPLGTELTDALHEWARVASAVRRSDSGTNEAASAASAVVTRRGLQLAGRIAASMGAPVGYLDPLTGEESVVEPPVDARPPRPQRPPEPVPWLTGLAVAGTSLALVLITILSLAITLAETHALLALASNAVVTAGLLPSLWLVRRQPIWRWVALGAAAAIAVGWVALPFIVL
ncbi:MAG: DUF2537 domain-containing protein [Actinophytocola sp.]|nr:DUF2537 domain-containing protein [Actinophytocola sp.]MPZ80118.1 DUF2537 domain-containing protein [Actinophytocola sp.]